MRIAGGCPLSRYEGGEGGQLISILRAFACLYI